MANNAINVLPFVIPKFQPTTVVVRFSSTKGKKKKRKELGGERNELKREKEHGITKSPRLQNSKSSSHCLAHDIAQARIQCCRSSSRWLDVKVENARELEVREDGRREGNYMERVLRFH